jgi:hypothetical protein
MPLSPVGEREGPAAQRWEGEGLCLIPARQALTLPTPPARAPSLSPAWERER